MTEPQEMVGVMIKIQKTSHNEIIVINQKTWFGMVKWSEWLRWILLIRCERETRQ